MALRYDQSMLQITNFIEQLEAEGHRYQEFLACFTLVPAKRKQRVEEALAFWITQEKLVLADYFRHQKGWDKLKWRPYLYLLKTALAHSDPAAEKRLDPFFQLEEKKRALFFLRHKINIPSLVLAGFCESSVSGVDLINQARKQLLTFYGQPPARASVCPLTAQVLLLQDDLLTDPSLQQHIDQCKHCSAQQLFWDKSFTFLEQKIPIEHVQGFRFHRAFRTDLEALLSFQGITKNFPSPVQKNFWEKFKSVFF